MKISIIIPVYNTEKYLKRCVDSCLNQTLDEIEIILIDDCSKDASRDIILDYANKYPDKVKYIFQKENHRQGAARNRGMEIARGEYLLFVDSDDWIESDMCRQMYARAIQENADMVGSDYYFSWDDRDELKKVNITPDLCGDMNHEKKSQYIDFYGMFWTRIYNSLWLKKCGLLFPEDTFYEDAFFNFYSVLYAGKIAHIGKPFYHYYQENQSTVRNRNNPHQYERIGLAEYIYNWGIKRKEFAEYIDIIEYKYLYMQGSNLLYTCLGLFDKPDKKKMKSIAIGVKGKKLYNGNAYKKLPQEIKFYMKLNIISSNLCLFIYKYKLYYYTKIIFNKLKGK